MRGVLEEQDVDLAKGLDLESTDDVGSKGASYYTTQLNTLQGEKVKLKNSIGRQKTEIKKEEDYMIHYQAEINKVMEEYIAAVKELEDVLSKKASAAENKPFPSPGGFQPQRSPAPFLQPTDNNFQPPPNIPQARPNTFQPPPQRPTAPPAANFQQQRPPAPIQPSPSHVQSAPRPTNTFQPPPSVRPQQRAPAPNTFTQPPQRPSAPTFQPPTSAPAISNFGPFLLFCFFSLHECSNNVKSS